MEFSHKCAIVTGAASDIGIAVATSIVQQQLCESVFLGDSPASSQRLEQARKALASASPGAQVDFDTFDASNESEVAGFFSNAAEKLRGRIDILVNVASYVNVTTDDASPNLVPTEKFDQSYELNQKSAFLLQRCFLRHLLQTPLSNNNIGSSDDSNNGNNNNSRGSIVHIVPYAAPLTLTLASSNHPILAATSNAIMGMCKTDAFDYAPDSIRVNCVAAADVLLLPQPAQQSQQQDQDPAATLEKQKQEQSIFPLGRPGTPHDVGNVVAFLSSPKASWLTGLIVPVDGGRHLGGFWPNQA